jgi:hypothetical protein
VNTNAIVNPFQDIFSTFSDLTIAIFLDSNSANVELVKTQSPTATLKSSKVLVSMNSRYLYKMLSSNLLEGSANSIRLVTAYPKSLQKLLLSFYEHVLEIENVEELIEMLYLADEYYMPQVMSALKQVFPPLLGDNDNNATTNPNAPNSSPSPQSRASSSASVITTTPSLEFTLANAPLFLLCSSRLKLNLEPRIFEGLAKEWAKFGPQAETDRAYKEHQKKCRILLGSLDFPETE